MIILFLSLLFAQTPVDHSTDRTHKSKHERTQFFAADGKTPCGKLAEFRNGAYYAFLTTGVHSQAFDTRPEAVKWIKLYCPVQGTTVNQ